MIQAIRPIYKGRPGQYLIDVINDANGTEIHHGYLVFDNPATTIDKIEEGKLLSHWSKGKREATLGWLREQLTAPVVP